MKRNIVKEKSFDFALKVVAVSRQIAMENNEYDLTRQFKRSGTSIGALIREAENAESRADFKHKISISLKEAGETEYWIDLLYRSTLMSDKDYHSLRNDISELNRILIAILKSSKA
jgi:four helix bundle protein